MRLSFTSVLALALIGTSIGCGGKSNSTTAPDKPAPTGESAKGDSPSLDGTYLVIESQMFGEKQTAEQLAKEPESDRTIVIKGDKILGLMDKSRTETIKLDSSKTPHEIDVTGPKGGKEDTINGIYKLEGDKLTIALGGEKHTDRPKDFNFGKNNIILVMTKKK